MIVKNEEEDFWDYESDVPDYHPMQRIYNDGSKAIEFITISDIYNKEEVGEDGELIEKYTLLKREVPSKRIILKDDIIGINQILNTKGNIKRSIVELTLRHQEPVIVKGDYNKLKQQLFFSKPRPAGFKFY